MSISTWWITWLPLPRTAVSLTSRKFNFYACRACTLWKQHRRFFATAMFVCVTLFVDGKVLLLSAYVRTKLIVFFVAIKFGYSGRSFREDEMIGWIIPARGNSAWYKITGLLITWYLRPVIPVIIGNPITTNPHTAVWTWQADLTNLRIFNEIPVPLVIFNWYFLMLI